MYILISIILFGILIAVHEFGHFITAKLCRVKVREFAIGMGPLLFKKQGEETLYTLRLLPIGGYCAMEGEDEESEDPRSFSAQHPLKKALVLVAGAALNFVFGLMLLLIVFMYSAPQTTEITRFMEGCPYESAETLHVGDEFYKVDGHRTYVVDDVSLFLNQGGDVHDIVVVRDGRIYAAGCILPLTQNTSLASELGTRHRAAIGMSEQSDAIIVVVSEETGAVSVARNGKLIRDVSNGELREILLDAFIVKDDHEPKAQKIRNRIFRNKGGKNNEG